jgi:hypothetical protein
MQHHHGTAVLTSKRDVDQRSGAPTRQPAARTAPPPAAGPLLHACGIPLSAVVQPLGTKTGAAAPIQQVSVAAPSLSRLARCRHCFAYINSLCELGDSSFTCSVCGRTTELKSLTPWHDRCGGKGGGSCA